MESGWDDEICDVVDVSYQVYKNDKYNGYNGLSDEKLQCIVHQMKKICQ